MSRRKPRGPGWQHRGTVCGDHPWTIEVEPWDPEGQGLTVSVWTGAGTAEHPWENASRAAGAFLEPDVARQAAAALVACAEFVEAQRAEEQSTGQEGS